MRFILIGSIALGLSSSLLHAQSQGSELTDEELMRRVQQQIERAEEITRGLVLVPVANSEKTVVIDDSAKNSGDIEADSGTTIKSANRVPETMEINIQIQFEFDSAVLVASEQPSLGQLCRVMQQSRNVKLFQIVGHTDSSGSNSYNMQLSQLRAEEVKRQLVEDCGIEEARLRAVGYGEEFPDNEDDTRAPENRRVELQVLG